MKKPTGTITLDFDKGEVIIKNETENTILNIPEIRDRYEKIIEAIGLEEICITQEEIQDIIMEAFFRNIESKEE